MHDISFILKNYIKDLAGIDDRINILVAKYKPDNVTELEDSKRVASFLNTIRNNLLDFHTLQDNFLS